MEQKEAPEKTSFIKWFSEINKDSGNLVGGKGANLGEMYNNNIPVPPGFVITAQAYTYFIEKAGIKEKIEELLGRINYEDTQQLDEITRQIRAFIIDSKLPENLQEEIIESYELLDVKPENIEKGAALDILKNSAEPVFVAVRSSATTEDLAEASFAGQQDTYLNIKGKNQLLEHIKKCFASLFTSRATYYRNKKGFPHNKSYLAVVVQKMINSDKSGVMFSRDPTNKSDNIILEAVWGLGEGIVSGKITPDHYIILHELEVLDKKIADKKIALTRTASGEKSEARLSPEKSRYQVLKEHEIMKLSDYAQRLEKHYQQSQDIEFAISDNELYIVQTRPITTIKKSEEKKEYEIGRASCRERVCHRV